MSFALIVEIALTGLLAATLVYCAILERRLSALRRGQDGFKKTIAELNDAILSAGTSIKHLKSTAAGVLETLDERLSKARGLADELSLLTASGDRIADRIARTGQPTNEPARPSVTPPVLAHRLDALRAPAARTEGTRAAAMGQVR